MDESYGRAGGALFNASARRVLELRRSLHVDSLSTRMRPRVPRDSALRLDPCSTANSRDDAVVAAAEPAPRVSANVIPDADHVPVPPDDPDDCRGGADHACRIGALHVLRERSSSTWLHSDGRSRAWRGDPVDKGGHL